MGVDEFLEYSPDYQATHEQIVFAHHLERMGKRFLIDFGFENAESITWDTMDHEELFQ